MTKGLGFNENIGRNAPMRFGVGRRALVEAAVLGVVYFLAATATIELSRFDNGLAFIWIANALLVARLAVLPPQAWAAPIAACTLASLASAALFGLGPIVGTFILPFVIGEAVIGAALLHRLPTRSAYLDSLTEVAAFALIVGVIAPAATAFGSAAVVSLVIGTPYWPNWIRWFTAHALGTICVAPLIIMFFRGDVREWLAEATARRRTEAAGLIALNLAVGLGVFAQSSLPLLFLPILSLMIATFRLGRLGAILSTMTLAVVGSALTLQGHGPIVLIDAQIGARILFFQFYLAVSILTVLPIAAGLRQSQAIFLDLQESEARFRLLADKSSDVIMNLSVGGQIHYVSPYITDLGGYHPATLIGTSASEMICAEDQAAVAATHYRAMAAPQEAFIIEYRARTITGAVKWCETNMRAVVDESGKVLGVVSAIRDISHHKTIERDLTLAANTDVLTGLPNRRAFTEMLERRIEDVGAGRGHGCCAAFDLDRFKSVNDLYGHEAGDRVLQAFAATAIGDLRDSDIFARLGGEEFGLILWNADLKAARIICERVREAVEALVVPVEGGARIGFTVSIGLTDIGAGSSQASLLRAADAALYRAKATGRNRLVLAV